jgi:hypothetical protein
MLGLLGILTIVGPLPFAGDRRARRTACVLLLVVALLVGCRWVLL